MNTYQDAYKDTKVTVEASRAAIRKIVEQWGAYALAWQDDLATGTSRLRFLWKCRGLDLCVRLDLRVLSPRSARAAERKDREREARRVHRVAYWWLKAMFEATNSGLFTPEQVLLPWIEVDDGSTFAERHLPALAESIGAQLDVQGKALQAKAIEKGQVRS